MGRTSEESQEEEVGKKRECRRGFGSSGIMISATKRPRSGDEDGRGGGDNEVEYAVDRISEVLLRARLLVARGEAEKARLKIKMEDMVKEQACIKDQMKLLFKEKMRMSERIEELEARCYDEQQRWQPLRASSLSEHARGEGVPAPHRAAGSEAEQVVNSRLATLLHLEMSTSKEGDGVILLDSDDEHDSNHSPARHLPAHLAVTAAAQHAGSSSGAMQGAESGGVGQRGGTGDVAEEDIVFVSASSMMGGDLPHPRSLCPTHRFQSDGGASNTAICELCYCYVCDCAASECKEWSSALGNHCSAHSGCPRWKKLRFDRKKVPPPIGELAIVLLSAAHASSSGGSLNQHEFPQRLPTSISVLVEGVEASFDLYHTGKETEVYNARSRGTAIFREHRLSGLGSLLQPFAAALGVDLDPRLDGALGSKPGGSVEQAGCHSSGRLAHYLTALDAMLGTTLRRTWKHRGGEGTPFSIAAREQYVLFIRGLAHCLAWCLLEYALPAISDERLPVVCPSIESISKQGAVTWNDIAAAAAKRVCTFKSLLPSRSSDISSFLDVILASAVNAWAALCHPGAGGRLLGHSAVEDPSELRQIRLDVLMSTKCRPRTLLTFLSSQKNSHMLHFPRILEYLLLDNGMVEPICDVIVNFLPTRSGVAHSWGSVMSVNEFFTVFSRFWVVDPSATIRFALRTVLLDVLPFRPDPARLNPIMSGRFQIIQNASVLLLEHAGSDAVRRWNGLWCLDSSDIRIDQIAFEHGSSLAEIRQSASHLFESTGVIDAELHDMASQGAHVRVAARARVRDALAKAPQLEKQGDKFALCSLFYLELLVEAAAKLHAMKPERTCSDMTALATHLASNGFALGVLSLTEALVPAKGTIRRRMMIPALLNARIYRGATVVGMDAEMSGASSRIQDANDVAYTESLHVSKALSSSTLQELLDSSRLPSPESDGPLAFDLRENLASLCLKIAQEGEFDAILSFAIGLVSSVPIVAPSAPNPHKGFWTKALELVPFARSQKKYGNIMTDNAGYLASCIVWGAFRSKPSLSLVDHINDDLEYGFNRFAEISIAKGSTHRGFSPMSKEEAAHILMGANMPYLEKFEGLAKLKCFGNAVRCLDHAMKIGTPAVVAKTVARVVIMVGMAAIESTAGISLFFQIVRSMEDAMRLRPLKPLECEKTLLSVYKAAAEVHPPAVRAFLQEQVTNVCAKFEGSDGTRMPSAETKSAFVQWLQDARTVCHTGSPLTPSMSVETDEWTKILKELKSGLHRRPSLCALCALCPP